MAKQRLETPTVRKRQNTGLAQGLGFSLHTPLKSISQPAMADIGCQSCLAGIIVL